ncbi:hypothetical protein [Bradyrhizobium japonicum]|uniref:hypothetical protein n=1 Tax=Bradyrhizobium japonicum TaxID=375 RepID=UPI0004180811|nr:hypothetical protein [Bradyrhizobium japonicum]
MTDTTIVTCVEAGPIEAQVLMLAESLRTFGGPAAKVPFIAVKPRRGPRIGSATLKEFKRLGVEFIDERLNVELDWWNNANKSCVMSQLETRVSTPNITWMDGDMVVLQQLDKLSPTAGTQFIARAGEGYLGSDGTDKNAPYWRKLCELIGSDFDRFPEINSFPEGRRIRAYWQTGIYTYATSTRLGEAHYATIKKLLSSSIGSREAGIYHQDQVSISLAVQKLELRHSEYDARLNFNVNTLAKENADLIPMSEVKILHYHNTFYREGLDWAKLYLRQLPQDRRELIEKYIPLTANASYPARVHRALLRWVRKKRVDEFKKRAVLH